MKTNVNKCIFENKIDNITRSKSFQRWHFTNWKPYKFLSFVHIPQQSNSQIRKDGVYFCTYVGVCDAMVIVVGAWIAASNLGRGATHKFTAWAQHSVVILFNLAIIKLDGFLSNVICKKQQWCTY